MFWSCILSEGVFVNPLVNKILPSQLKKKKKKEWRGMDANRMSSLMLPEQQEVYVVH